MFSAAVAMVADAVEMMLYEDEARKRRDPRLREIARSLARSPEAGVRAKMLYFAGSPVRASESALEVVAFRDELLSTLITHEDGVLLDTLIWKICESSTERGGAVERLVELCRRFDRPAMRRGFSIGFMPPIGLTLKPALQAALRASGLPELEDDG